jgi:energy-coupling factor transport system permease protein
MKRSFAAQAWVIWLLTMATFTLLTRNPFYILILLLVARVVQAACALPGVGVKLRFWRIALIIISLSILFNVFLVHIGETVIMTLPENWWVIGGSLTLEAAVYGVISGLTLVTLLAVFLAFNSVVPTSELIRLTPRALANIGLVVMIAVTYVPETMDQLQRIRDAQAIRGHRLRGIRDWQPIVIPLLIGGLERAMNLAETMVARGYGATTNVRHSTALQLGLLATLLLTLGGWMLTFWIGRYGWVLVLAGFALIAGMSRWLGKQVTHTRYRSRSWNKWDWMVVLCTMVPFLVVIFPIPFMDRSALFYTPYPQATLPSFDVLLGLALATLVLPAILVEL